MRLVTRHLSLVTILEDAFRVDRQPPDFGARRLINDRFHHVVAAAQAIGDAGIVDEIVITGRLLLFAYFEARAELQIGALDALMWREVNREDLAEQGTRRAIHF